MMIYPRQSIYYSGKHYVYKAAFPETRLDFKGVDHDRGPLSSNDFFELSTIYRRRKYTSDKWKQVQDKDKIHYKIRRTIINKLVRNHNKMISCARKSERSHSFKR